MFKPPSLSSRQLRNLRHWGMELVVVVAGVLLALWAQAWFEGRQQARSDKLSEAAIRREILGNIVTLASWQAIAPCHDEQIRHLREMLLNTDGNWPGVERRAVFVSSGEQRSTPGIYMLWAQRTETPVWDAAVAGGVPDRWDSDKRIDYQLANALFDEYAAAINQAFAARARIGALAFPGRLSDSDRYDALNQLILLDNAREYIARPRQFMQIEFTKEEMRDLREQLVEEDRNLRRFGEPRPCYSGHRIPEIFQEDVE